MKSYLPIIASLFLVSTPLVLPATASETEIVATEINPYIKDNIAIDISVKITSADSGGSGVIIAQDDNTYLVLTNSHVLRDGEEFAIATHDGVTHQATFVEDGIATDDDLALLEFTSDRSYQTATINTAATPRVEQTILAVGYSAQTGELVTEAGKIERVPDKSFKEGYSIGYSSNVVGGMSGGAIINTDGEVIGINGKGAFPIVNTGYDREDGTKPSAEEIEEYRQLSWGIGINRLLAQVDSELISAYNLPLPETPESIKTEQLTGWLGELEAKAKQITVRIDSSSGANGSGVIIAKEGNTYTVLTAAHVVCEQDDSSSCINYAYEIVTPDGNKHTLDANTIKAETGVDLATFKFTSNQSYQVAQLADYSIQRSNAVFVAGYPKLRQDTAPQWLFSLGYSADREQGLINVNINNSPQSENSATLNQSSLAGGYELVYTSPTYGGMSGGAVLDKQGRVIGIHGQAEGEAIIGSRGEGLDKIQLGSSLGIAIDTFIGLKDRLGVGKISPVENDAPAELNSSEIEVMFAAMSEAEITDSNTTAKGWLKRGNQLERLGQFDEAVAAFERAIALEPEFIHLAYYGKGRTLIAIPEERTGREEDELALDSFERATSSNPKFAPAFQYKSFVLRRLNRLEEALVAIETATILEPKNANYYLQLANILSNLQRFDEAVVAYDKAIEIAPRSSYYYNRGNLYKKQGKTDLALEDYNQTLAIEPNNVYAYNSRGNLYAEQGKTDLALEDYNQTLAIEPNNVYAYNSRGNLHAEQGKTDLALADYNQALALDSNYASAYYNRGILYAEQEKTDLALADYNQALALDPNYASAYINRGALYQEQGKTDLALADYNQAMVLEPNHADAYNNRGTLYDEQGKTDLALADYNQALAIETHYADAYNSRGWLYYRQGKTELALADYNQALGIEPNHATAYNNRGIVYAEQEKADLALENFNQALTIEPNYAIAYNNRGIVYAEQGKTELALADYTQALALEPKYGDAYYNRGNLYKEQEKTELALADYTQTLSLDPNYANAYHNRGLVYLEMGDKKAAISDLRQAQQLYVAQNNTASAEQTASILRALEQTPTQTTANTSQNESIASNDAQAYYNRAAGYHEQGEVELALENYNQALALDPTHTNAYTNRGALYAEKGKADLALADLNQALALDPKLAAAYYNRGLLYAQQGKADLALENYNQALALDPTDAKTYINRGLLYAEQGKTDLALENFNQALALNPNYAIAYSNRGILYLEQGKTDLALENFNQAIALNPKLAIAYTSRGLLYARQGKTDLALADYNQALALDPTEAFTYYNRGWLYEQTGDRKAAISDLRQAQQLFVAQNNTVNAEQTASILQALDRTPTAQTTVNTSQKDNRASFYSGQVVTVFFPDGTPSYARAINPNQKRENENTIAKYDRAIEINPNNSDAYRNRGLLYYQQGQFKLAETDLSKAIELNAEDAGAYHTLGLVHLSSSTSSLAETELKTAKRLATSQNKTELAEEIDKVLRTIHRNNEYENAIAEYDRAIEINPNNSTAYRNRGILYHQERQSELAETDLSKAIELNPKDAEAYYNRGTIYLTQKKYDLAIGDGRRRNKRFNRAAFKTRTLGISSSKQTQCKSC